MFHTLQTTIRIEISNILEVYKACVIKYYLDKIYNQIVNCQLTRSEI